MKIKLFYDDEYIEGKNDYSGAIVTVDNWLDFWDMWNNAGDFIMCDDFDGKRSYIKKDRVIQILED